MPITITVNNKSFNIPVPGEDPGWGGDTTDWIREISSVVNSLFGAGDILESNATIENNQSVAQDITGLAFDPSTVRAAFIEYSVYRISDTNPSDNVESGNIYIVYDNAATSGSQWLLSREHSGESGIDINITDGGQLTYTSNDLGITNYSGVISFKARTLSQ